MTTDERLDKLEKGMSRANRRNRWLLAGAALWRAAWTTAFGRIGRSVRRRPRALLLVTLLSLAVITALVGLFVWPGGESNLHGPGVNLFDGEMLTGWRVVEGDGHGEVYVRNGQLVLERGARSTNIVFTGSVPRTNYEIKVEAMRMDGPGCLFHLAFPVGDSHCLLLVGAERTRVVLEQVDGLPIPENPTARFIPIEEDRWYRIRLRVTPADITVWIDNDKMINVSLAKHSVDMPPAWTILQPLGLGNWESACAFRTIRIRRLRPAK